MLRDRRAQSAVQGFLIIMVLVAVAAGLVDVYRLYAARNWAYQVAQEAALSGASRGRDFSAVATTGDIRLNAAVSQDTAEQIVQAEMNYRGITGYTMDVRVLPDPAGGTINGYPIRPVRLGVGRGAWSSPEPAVGVYLSMPVDWLLLDILGITEKAVYVFASAGVVQP